MCHTKGRVCLARLRLAMSVLLMVGLTACNAMDKATPTPAAQSGEATVEPVRTAALTATASMTAVTTVTATGGVTTTTGPGERASITSSPTFTPVQGLTVTTALTGAASMTTTGVWGMPERNRTMRATALLGHPIQNQQREDVGQVADVLIGWPSGRVLYVMVGYGGLLNLGQQIFPIPPSIFRYQADDAGFVLDVSDATLQNAPSFTVDAPLMTDRQFQQDVATFWQSVDSALITRTLQAGELRVLPKELLYVSALIGSAVQNFQGESVGQVQDVMLDLGTGTVSYAVLSFGGFLGIGDKLFAIPLRAFEFDPADLARSTTQETKPTLRLDINEEALAAAPGFDPDAYPDTAAPAWDAEIRRYWH